MRSAAIISDVPANVTFGSYAGETGAEHAPTKRAASHNADGHREVRAARWLAGAGLVARGCDVRIGSDLQIGAGFPAMSSVGVPDDRGGVRA